MPLGLGGGSGTSSGTSSGGSATSSSRLARLRRLRAESERAAARRRQDIGAAEADPDELILNPSRFLRSQPARVTRASARTLADERQIARGRSLRRLQQQAFREFFSPAVGANATRRASRRRRQQTLLASGSPASSSITLGQPTVLGA